MPWINSQICQATGVGTCKTHGVMVPGKCSSGGGYSPEVGGGGGALRATTPPSKSLYHHFFAPPPSHRTRRRAARGLYEGVERARKTLVVMLLRPSGKLPALIVMGQAPYPLIYTKAKLKEGNSFLSSLSPLARYM